MFAQAGEDAFQIDFRQHLQRACVQLQTARAQRHLRGGFFAADIQHRHIGGEHRQRLQQQRGFAHARVAAEQHHATGDQPAAQHAVEFFHARADAHFFARIHATQL